MGGVVDWTTEAVSDAADWTADKINSLGPAKYLFLPLAATGAALDLAGAGSGNKPPKLGALPMPPPPKDPMNEEIQKAMAAQRRRSAAMGGTGATFLTGPAGLPGLAPTFRPTATGY